MSIYLAERGRLPSLWGLFDMYGGPWSARYSTTTLVGLLLAFLAVTLVVAGSGWLMWNARRTGAVLNLTLLPLEAVFWIGFALPLPWLIGVARAVLLLGAWKAWRDRG